MTASPRTALEAGFHIIIPVWGESYTRTFVELCLPTLLAPGNIPALPHPERHAFMIYTTPDHRHLIEAAPAFSRLRSLIRVEFHPVRQRLKYITAPYETQSDCYRRAIRRADAADKAMVFLTPDLIMADGGFRELARIADTQVRAVLGAGIRLDKAAVRDHLLAVHGSGLGDAIAIAPRDLVRLALTTLHPIAHAHLFDGKGEELLLSHLYWQVGGEGLLARCFHLHPFLVYPRIKNARFTSTIDGDYLEAACPDPGDIYVITDSDEFSAWELSESDRRLPAIRRGDRRAMLDWLRQYTTPRHRRLVGSVLRIHTGISDHALWHSVERTAETEIASVLSLLNEGEANGNAEEKPVAVQAADSDVPVIVATALRNEADANHFLDIALPSLLAPGNIGAQACRERFSYRIVAAAAARPILDASPVFAELRDHIPVEVETRERIVAEVGASAGSVGRAAIDIAQAASAAVMFVDPDTVLADGSLKIIGTALRRRMRAILVPRLRLRRATASRALRRDYWIDGILSIHRTELVRLALDHLHPLAMAQFADREDLGADPTTLCWKVGSDGVVMHAFDLYPLVIHPRAGGPAADAVDHALLGALGFGASEISIIRDSQVLVHCQLSDDDAVMPLLPRRDVQSIAGWAAENTGSFDRLVFRNEIRLRTDDGMSPRWAAASAAASTAVLEILGALASMEPQRRRA